MEEKYRFSGVKFSFIRVKNHPARNIALSKITLSSAASTPFRVTSCALSKRAITRIRKTNVLWIK